MSHTLRERIPERLVHAKGVGAFGEFEVTHDITSFTSAAFLNTVGKKTPLFFRGSTVAGEKGSADTVRDLRGFAFKFYTEEGNLDWLALTFPVFFIRDSLKFSALIHAQKKNPQTNLQDPSAFWDYFNGNAEGYNALMHLFGGQGIPATYRHADAFLINTYKFTQQDGSFSYVKIHIKTDQGVRNLSSAQAQSVVGQDVDFATRDLFENIAAGNYPSWTVYAQIISPQDAQANETDLFDATKQISQTEYPLQPFGKITLNRNPQNNFAQTEQSAFAPANLVPGFDISADPVLQMRMFVYGDTQRYRLGVNHQQLPVNRPNYSYQPLKRDGANNLHDYGAIPNYEPSSFAPPLKPAPQYRQPADHDDWIGMVTSFESTVSAADFVQPRAYWQGLGDDEQTQFVNNVAASLSNAVQSVRNQTYDIFAVIDPWLGQQILNVTETTVLTNAGQNGNGVGGST